MITNAGGYILHDLIERGTCPQKGSMIQPKFKLGDKVVGTHKAVKAGCYPLETGETEKVFTVKEIIHSETGITYQGLDEAYCHVRFKEESVRLYVEPKPKKLYAYIAGELSNEGDTRETIKCWMEEDTWKGIFWKRAPEFDIEYPEEK
jgi:hypothetical protein